MAQAAKSTLGKSQGPFKVGAEESTNGQSDILQRLIGAPTNVKKESPMSPSELKACPKCGKLFKPAGLVGHLYHVHGIGKAELDKVSGQAPVDAVGAVKRIQSLSETLDNIRKERKALQDKDTSSSWSGKVDKPVKALLDSLDWAEGEIIRELKILGVKFDEEKKKS